MSINDALLPKDVHFQEIAMNSLNDLEVRVALLEKELAAARAALKDVEWPLTFFTEWKRKHRHTLSHL